jgi:uncharacterized coiled-coil protein SlyX
MKQYIALAAMAATLIFSCKDYKPEVDRLNHVRDSLLHAGGEKDSTIDGFLGNFNSINSSLDSINQLHNAITMDQKDNPEMKGTVKDRIRQNIESINRLLEQNSKRIAELSSKVKNSSVKLAQLQKMIGELNIKIAEKDSMITMLNTQVSEANVTISSLKTSVDTLNTVVKEKTQTVEEKTNMLNTAYYTMGTYKQLRDKKVLTKQGGFLGMGSNQMMIADFDTTQFTKVDITQTSTIPINTKDAKIITNHPTTTYRLDRTKDKVNSINISDVNRFWSSSKYLVIVTK